MRAPRSERGLTLIELMVSMAVAAFAITAILLAFYAQTSAYASEHRQMFAQAGAREALDFMEHTLRNGGYGVDPSLALLAYDGFNPDAENQTAPDLAYPDAFVVHYRDLEFQRTLTPGGVGAASLTFSSDPGRIFRGQILLLLCSAAEENAYVTVSGQPDPNRVTLEALADAPADSPIGGPGAQFHQEARLGDACFQRGGVVAVKVDRAAFFVSAFADDPAQPNVKTPYLMLHQGLDRDGSGTIDAADAVPLAANVEQLQVAYLMDTVSPTCSAPAIHGVTDSPPWGTAWRTGFGPTLDTPYADPIRCNNDVGNVRQVRVTLVARAGKQPGATGDDAFSPGAANGKLASGTVAWKPLENLTAPPAPYNPKGGGYQRVVLRTAVGTANLAMRSQFLPLSHGG